MPYDKGISSTCCTNLGFNETLSLAGALVDMGNALLEGALESTLKDFQKSKR